MLRNHFTWPICHLLHKDKELLALRNNFRATKKFLIAKFDCTYFQFCPILKRVVLCTKLKIPLIESNSIFCVPHNLNCCSNDMKNGSEKNWPVCCVPLYCFESKLVGVHKQPCHWYWCNPLFEPIHPKKRSAKKIFLSQPAIKLRTGN